MPGTPRRRTLRLRTQLLLVLALALAASAAQFAFFVQASAAARRAQDVALAWSHHAILVKEIEAATATYLRDLDAVLLRGAAVDLSTSRRRVAEAAEASRLAAAAFSEEEQAEERELGEGLVRLLARGDHAARLGLADAFDGVRAHFEQQVRPLLTRRIQEEEEGARAAAELGASAARRALRLAGVAGLILLAGALGVVAGVARRIHRGLAELEQGARQLAGGHLAAVVPSGADELGAVGAAFNSMSAQLRETTVSRTELEGLVRQRTQALERSSEELSRNLSELRETQMQLAAASRLAAVGAMAAGVAHEMNNPLSFVVANTGFARDSLKEIVERLAAGDAPTAAQIEEVLEALDEARLGANRVREIVRDLRTFARSEEERREPVELGRVVDSALRMASAELRKVGRVVRELPELPPADASEGRLAQVFLNLLVNAVHAMPDRSPSENEIRISGEATASEVAISVSDNGVGIPEANLERVFEPFFTTKPSGLGTGLGLAICRRLVHQLGGTITVESRPGAGTTFRVALRRAAAPRPEPRPQLVSPTLTGPHGRILLVDDESLVVTSLQRILAGHQVETASDGRAALALLRQGRDYDAILVDLVMAGMNGMELYAALEQEFPALVPRVLIVTGAAFSPGAREFLERVPNPRLEKPFDPEVLRRVVQQLVASHRGLLTPEPPPLRPRSAAGG